MRLYGPPDLKSMCILKLDAIDIIKEVIIAVENVIDVASAV